MDGLGAMGDLKTLVFPWDDGSSEQVTVSYDPTASTEDYTALLSIFSPLYRGSTSRSKVSTLALDGQLDATAVINLVQTKPVENVLTMEFRKSDGSWAEGVTLNTDAGGAKVYIRCMLRSTIYDISGTPTVREVVMDSSNYGSLFTLSIPAASGALLTLGSDSAGVFVSVAKNTIAFVGALQIDAAYQGEYGSATDVGFITLASEQFTVRSLQLLGSFEGGSYVSSVSVPTGGGVVSLAYSAEVLMADGSIAVKQFTVGSSEMGGTLSSTLLGGTIPYGDSSKWRSVTLAPNTTTSVIPYTITWSWEGLTASLSIAQAAKVVVTEVSRYLVLVASPLVYPVAGGSGTYTVSGFARMSDGSVKSLGDVTSSATVTSSAGWLSVRGGVISVSKNPQVGDPREATLSASLSGYTGASVSLSQESSQELGRDLVLELTPTTMDWEGGSGTYKVTGVIRMVDGSTQSAGDLTSSATVSSPSSWITFANGRFTVVSFDVVGAPRVADITATLDGYTPAAGLFTQTGKVETVWGAPSGGVLTVQDIPAGGGSISSGVLSGTLTQVATTGSEVVTHTFTFDDVTGGSWSTAVSAPSLEITERGRTKVGVLTYSYTLNGVSGSVSADVYQQANTVTYGAITFENGTVDDIPASGGSVSKVRGLEALQEVSYTSGVSDLVGLSISYSSPIYAPSLGTTIRDRKKRGVLTASASNAGVSASQSFDIYQGANEATYGSWSDSFTLIPSSVSSFGDYVMYTGSSSRPVSYTSGDSEEEYSPISSVSVLGGVSWVVVDENLNRLVVSDNKDADSRSAQVECYFENGRSVQATLTQDGQGLNIYIKVINDSPDIINWQAVGTLALNEQAVSANYYSSYYTTVDMGVSQSTIGCGLIIPQAGDVREILSAQVLDSILFVTNTDGEKVERGMSIWVELVSAYSTGEDDVGATIGSRDAPMVTGLTNGFGVSSESVSAMPSIYVENVRDYRICYRVY